MLPRTGKQGIGAITISSVSLLVGVLIGSRLKSGKGGKDENR